MHAGRLVARALDDSDVRTMLRGAAAIDVIAAGKAAAAMANAFVARPDVPAARRVLAIGPQPAPLAAGVEWITGGHPLPTDGSVAGARRARAIARASGPDDLLVVLLSGGGSALMALPAEGITLGEKQTTAQLLMQESADIHELNTVRKHLSAIKGGQLAAACGGSVLTLAVSDVVGDDLSVIASGPTVPDDSTFAAALDVLERRGGTTHYPAGVVTRLRRGVEGGAGETPKPGDPRLLRSNARVIGRQRGAIDGARTAAEALGYHVHVIDAPVTGEARLTAVEHVRRLERIVEPLPRPLCVISSGETTVTVRGHGKGGRNQEFALAMSLSIATLGQSVVAASIGTDGIDGPTDAAGAIVDASTLARARALRLDDPRHYLDNNDAYAFFDALGDLVRTGPTDTNVGDLQVLLIAE